MGTAERVTITVSFSGWLARYFADSQISISTTPRLQEALPDMLEQVLPQAQSPIPQGGMHILVNGMVAQKLIQENYSLRDGDEVTFVPVVAGGAAW
jgi:molybdopterin converting factor small subunit